jgi:hypothetical protein
MVSIFLLEAYETQYRIYKLSGLLNAKDMKNCFSNDKQIFYFDLEKWIQATIWYSENSLENQNGRECVIHLQTKGKGECKWNQRFGTGTKEVKESKKSDNVGRCK